MLFMPTWRSALRNEKPARERGERTLAGCGRKALLGFGGFGFRRFLGLFAATPVVFLLEFLDAAGRIDELHLAGKKRMARRADFDGNVLFGAARREAVAATA